MPLRDPGAFLVFSWPPEELGTAKEPFLVRMVPRDCEWRRMLNFSD